MINDYKFMPGASMTVRSGAVLEVAPATILVFYDQFEDVENNDVAAELNCRKIDGAVCRWQPRLFGES